jgi:hypothetical protein
LTECTHTPKVAYSVVASATAPSPARLDRGYALFTNSPEEVFYELRQYGVLGSR